MSKDRIAIIGIGCRFPGGINHPDALWKLLIEGREAVSDVPPIRWHVADGLAALVQEFPKRVGVIDSAGESATDSDDSNAVLRHLN